ncbi:MAG: histidine--tRNA ligase [Tenericutes bacterium]|nr:histidine--tRNA ligase [Mycoplasmatota bacterium]
MKVKPRTLSGYMELLPKDQIKFNNMLDIIKRNYEYFGFLPLDTPILEASEVLLAKVGGETEKQIYRIDDKVMRFDLTVPLAKYVVLNYGNLSFPFRRYQIGKVYRGERAQKGRFREFYQADIDIIGDNELSIYNDAEIPYIIYKIFKELNIGEFKIKINNRKLLNGYFEYLEINDKASSIMNIIDKLRKIGASEVTEELISIGIKEEKVKNIIAFVTMNADIEVLKKFKLNIDNKNFSEGVNELDQVLKYSNNLGLDKKYIEIDLTISRGLDYYTGTVYETYLNDYPNIGSICSGGRYDNLASYYTDKVLPGVGISIGVTRLFDQLLELNLIKDEEINVSDILIIPMTENYEYISKCYKEVQKNKKKTQIFYEKRSIKSIINYALSLNIKKVMFIGDDEVNNNTVTIKDLDKGEQNTIKINEMKRYL